MIEGVQIIEPGHENQNNFIHSQPYYARLYNRMIMMKLRQVGIMGPLVGGGVYYT